MNEMQICENINFFNYIFKQTDQRNQTDYFGSVSFLVKTESNRSNEDSIGSDIYLTKNRSKPNRYTLNYNKYNIIKKQI